MTVKLVVLYPQPLDIEVFERDYTQHHLALMRELVGPDVPLPAFKVAAGSPYYRVAEIHFRDRNHLKDFIESGKADIGRESSEKVSTGGKPIYLVCNQQPEI